MKKALLFLSLLSFFGFVACNDKSDDEENETFAIHYNVIWDNPSAAATDIVIFELDEKRNVVNKQTISYIPQCGIDGEERMLSTTSDVTQVEIYHKSEGRYYFTYHRMDEYIFLSNNQITKEQYDNATQR